MKTKEAMRTQFLIQLFFLIFSIAPVNAQTIESWIESKEKIPAEKIYVHTDSERYFAGDTLWFKVYLIDSRSGQLLPGVENVYVNLISESGESVTRAILLSRNGQAVGRFVIHDKFKSGNYLLQVHTNYLLNFGSQAFFYQHIPISTISGSSRMITRSNPSGNMIADVKFLPEGEVLLENSTNLVAFKAVDRYGFGVDVSGKIKDEKGTVVTTFASDYKGMGLLFLMPESNKKYYATIDGFMSYRYEFEPVKNRYKIQLVNYTSKELILNISGNSPDEMQKEFTLVNMHMGEVVFYQKIELEGKNKVLKIESNLLKPGINKLVLLDESYNSISERFVFSESFEKNDLIIKTDKELYDKKSQISIKIKDDTFIKDSAFSSLSLAVVHDLAVPEDGNFKNIISHLYIHSEINGFVESSAGFLNDSLISSEAKLRLLMLTSDSDSYFWNSAPLNTEELVFEQEYGINVSGIASNSLSKSIIKNGEITMAIQKDEEMAFLTQNTDSAGRFVFQGLLFSDTAKIHVQAKTESGKMNVDVVLDTIFQHEQPDDAQFKILRNKTIIQSELAALKYQIYNENRKSKTTGKKARRKSRKSEQVKEDGHIRLYESADFVLEVDPDEQSYANVLDYMVGKIPGVDVGSDFVRIRGASSFGGNTLPLFLLDGVPLVGSQSLDLPVGTNFSGDEQSFGDNNSSLIRSVQSIPLSDVDKIEVLKSSQNTALFGVKGSNGVVAIYTRRGEKPDGISNKKGIVEKEVVGYLQHSSFYSPDYQTETAESSAPDLRTLLYWNPEIEVKNGETEIRFYTSMQSGKYHVIVEGVNSNGTICTGSTVLEVK